jgi:hypothetical protein
MSTIRHAALFIFAIVFAIPALAAPPKVLPGAYECWAHGAPRLLMNFKVTGDGRYSNEDGNEKGAFASGLVLFKGGHLDGAMPDGFTAVYEARKARNVLSFRGRSGGEAAFCEHQGR